MQYGDIFSIILSYNGFIKILLKSCIDNSFFILSIIFCFNDIFIYYKNYLYIIIMFDTNYYTKIGSISLIIFIILLFLKTLTFSNALLLALIVGISTMIIDNLYSMNTTDCSECKIDKFANINDIEIPQIQNTIYTNTNPTLNGYNPNVQFNVAPTPPAVNVYNPNISKIPNTNTAVNVYNPGVSPTPNTNASDNKLDYMNDYVQYQTNGEEAKQMDDSLKNYQYKLSAGNQLLSVPYLKDAQKFYDDIQKRGVNNPNPDELVKANLEYGTEYNYLGPLNFGMSNREYSYIMPNNWNVIQAVPPVCAINKKLKSVVYPVLHTSNAASWSSLEEFDRASRFTGNQQINIDYIKNVLNNPYV